MHSERNRATISCIGYALLFSAIAALGADSSAGALEGEGSMPDGCIPAGEPPGAHHFCDFWPLAKGNHWATADASADVSVTEHFLVNGVRVWRYIFEYSSEFQVDVDGYIFFADGWQWFVENRADLETLPTIPETAVSEYPEILEDGAIQGDYTYRIGRLDELLPTNDGAGLTLSPDDFPDIPDCRLMWAIYFENEFVSGLAALYEFGHGIVYSGGGQYFTDATVAGDCDSPPTLNSPHSADWNADTRISLSELLRGIQHYNLDGLHCDANSVDGYAPGSDAGQQTCTPHSGDYDPQDWRISLDELLRLIQILNAGGYYPCAGEGEGSADGFCLGVK